MRTLAARAAFNKEVIVLKLSSFSRNDALTNQHVGQLNIAMNIAKIVENLSPSKMYMVHRSILTAAPSFIQGVFLFLLTI